MSIRRNIVSGSRYIQLSAKKYKVDIIGGFGISLGDFELHLKNIENGEIYKCEPIFIGLQSYKYGRKSKRVFSLEIKTKGEYEIIYKNIESLEVRSSNLFLLSFFSNPLKLNKLDFFFY